MCGWLLCLSPPPLPRRRPPYSGNNHWHDFAIVVRARSMFWYVKCQPRVHHSGFVRIHDLFLIAFDTTFCLRCNRYSCCISSRMKKTGLHPAMPPSRGHSSPSPFTRSSSPPPFKSLQQSPVTPPYIPSLRCRPGSKKPSSSPPSPTAHT